MPRALYVEISFQSSYWVHEPLTTARRPTYIVPPPTTLVGALSFGIARALHVRGEAGTGELGKGRTSPLYYELSKRVENVFYAQLSGYAVVKEDISRFFQAPYIRRDNVFDPQMRWGVKVSSKVYAPLVKSCIIYVLSDDIHELIEDEILKRGAYSIKRVGSLESIVSVDTVEVVDVEIAKFPEVEDIFVNQGLYPYMNVELGTKPEGFDPSPWISTLMPSHKRIDYWVWASEGVHKAYTHFVIPTDKSLLKMKVVAPFTWGPEIVEQIVERNRNVFNEMIAYVIRVRRVELVLPATR